ncbi:MAG: Eco57I restriction-modification methylase domain-containing protein, partial [Planctomycetaceae bacterium]|nr:Eco57I restriction-modification methylase domain-containing protein [Planctomycetaceae bacterium]
LETKFICANTLIGLTKEKGKLQLQTVKTTVKQLQLTREQHVVANTPQQKKILQDYDKELRQLLSEAMEGAGELSHETAELLLKWNPYDQTKSTPFFDPQWMFGIDDGFDVVIGNPPYVEARSASVSKELKELYQKQVKTEFDDLSQYITKGADLLIYFFSRSITLLAESGAGILIVQNGWLNADYGTKASRFLLKTLQNINITDSSFRHFNRNSANINTVIVKFQKKSNKKIICFDTMNKDGQNIIVQNKKIFNIDNNILSDLKWGIITATNNEILTILIKIIECGKNIDQSFYSIGQGINVNQKTFIPESEKTQFKQKENIINAVFKEYKYTYADFSYFVYHSFNYNKSDTSVLEKLQAEEFCSDVSLNRKYPSIIMPRGIGTSHFAGLINGIALSNSFVDVYIKTQDDEKILNIWLFCNSSLFFLYRELSGRKNLGGGLLKSEAADVKLFPLYFPITNKKIIQTIINKTSTPCNLQKRLETTVQKEIDDLVFSYFKIPPNLQTKILNELLRLFQLRCNKAK